MSYIYEVFEHILRQGMGIWLHNHTVTTTDTSPCESSLKSYLMQMCKPCHYTLVESVEPFKLHPPSLSCIHEVLEHLLRL
jgi:hypothetical protein